MDLRPLELIFDIYTKYITSEYIHRSECGCSRGGVVTRPRGNKGDFFLTPADDVQS